MGRKTKSRRTLLSGKRKMLKVRGKFREAKKYSSITKKVKKKETTKKYKYTKPKVDRTKKVSLIKKLREFAKSLDKEDE
jgi:hypothetical protein